MKPIDRSPSPSARSRAIAHRRCGLPAYPRRHRARTRIPIRQRRRGAPEGAGPQRVLSRSSPARPEGFALPDDGGLPVVGRVARRQPDPGPGTHRRDLQRPTGDVPPRRRLPIACRRRQHGGRRHPGRRPVGGTQDPGSLKRRHRRRPNRRRGHGQALLRRKSPTRVVLEAENDAYDPIEVDLRSQELVIEGLSVGVIRTQPMRHRHVGAKPGLRAPEA